MKCKKCLYMWEGRVSEPKACPRCKNRLDYDLTLLKTRVDKSTGPNRETIREALTENNMNNNLKEVM